MEREAAVAEPTVQGKNSLAPGTDRPGKELVGAGAHGLEDLFAVRACRDGEDGQRRAACAHALDGGHPGRHVGADIHNEDVRPGAVSPGPAVYDSNRHTPGPQQERHLALELFVVTDNRCCNLGHGRTYRISEALLNKAKRLWE
jgi:hypothetical protein